jgi:hypothetical protein
MPGLICRAPKRKTANQKQKENLSSPTFDKGAKK